MTLDEIYNKMTTRFTSNHFGDFAKKHKALSAREITNGAIAGYLRGKNCKRISNRTWEKPSDHIADITFKIKPLKESTREEINKIYASDSMPVETVSMFLEKLPMDSIINHVKSKGYLVLTP